MKTYSVLIAWNDNDREQGDFGEIVRAESPEKAERIVRARMVRSHWDSYWDKDLESRRDCLSSYTNPDGSYFGSVIDMHEGAIWRAKELEEALRALRLAVVPFEDDPNLDAAKIKADAVLAEIDGL
ncbi:MAG: hypothetical protein EOQ56_28090 [Mesorhizobium sp.]|nr:MAG: hypothetical protein EOQ56_28090 [Mesorhizobium sp.]